MVNQVFFKCTLRYYFQLNHKFGVVERFRLCKIKVFSCSRVKDAERAESNLNTFTCGNIVYNSLCSVTWLRMFSLYRRIMDLNTILVIAVVSSEQSKWSLPTAALGIPSGWQVEFCSSLRLQTAHLPLCVCSFPFLLSKCSSVISGFHVKTWA